MSPDLRFPGYVDTWSRVRLGDISETFSGSTPSSTNKKYYDGTIPFIKSGEISNSTTSQTITDLGLASSSAKMVRRGDILYALYGATSGQVAISKIDGAINQAVLCIRPNANRYFIYSYLQKNKSKIVDMYLQGGQGNLSAEIVKSIAVPVPCVEEQEKIAEFLTAVDERIKLASRKVEKLETYKRGLAQKIFTRTLRFKRYDGSDFPDWGEKHIGDIGKVVTGKTPATSKKELWNGGLAFITPTDIVEGKKYQFLTERTVSEGYVNDILPVGTTVFTCIASIGKMAITSIPSVTNQQINSIIPSEFVDQEFLFYAVQSIAPKIKASQASNTLPIINKTEFSKFRVPVPDKAEQQKIATFLSQIDEKITLETRKLEELKTFKKALLQRMFV